MCDPKYDYPISFDTEFKEQNGHQYLNISANLKTPIGLNQSVLPVFDFQNKILNINFQMNTTFEYSETQDNFMPLFKFSRSDLCDFFNKDLGSFWFELQKQIGVPVRTCPIGIVRQLHTIIFYFRIKYLGSIQRE